MRADRLLSILLLLQVHGRQTARALALRLEVSERTILRDMEALGAAGVPVVADRGAGGGWRLLEGYKTDLTGLAPDEAQALFLAGPARLLSDLGLERASQAALLKLLASLPSVARRRAEHARQRIHIDVTGWSRGEAAPHLPALQEAVWQDRRVRFLYDRGDDYPGERVVDPLGLVAKGSVWYLAAGVDGEIRAYRVSRMREVEMTDAPSVRPEGFDLAAWWQEHAAVFQANFPRYYATLRVHPEVFPRLRYAGRFSRIEKAGELDGEGWREVVIRCQLEEEAAEIALSFGSGVEVLEPPELRERVIQMAGDVVAFYSEQKNAG